MIRNGSGNMKKTNVDKLMVVMTVMCLGSVLAEDIAFTEETAAAYLKLTPPVKVLFYGGYMDGGSIGISLADAAGKEFHIFEDYSMGSGGGEFMIGKTNYPESLRAIYDRPVTEGRIFIGQGSPTKDREITPVEKGKLIKTAVDCLAVAWFDREVTPEEQTLLTEYFQQKHKGENPNRLVLKNKMVPPMKRGETSEESRALFDIYMKGIYRFEAALYIAAKLKGMEPPRKKVEPTKPEP